MPPAPDSSMTPTEYLRSLLYPDIHLSNSEAWGELTSKFPEGLRKLVVEMGDGMSDRGIDESFRVIEAGVEWWRTRIVGRGFPKDPSLESQVQGQLDALGDLLRGAREAVRPSGRRDDLRGWALGTRDWLTGRSTQSAAAACVLVEDGEARVHTLWLEVMPGGSGRLFRHPKDALVDCPPGGGFLAAMTRAWQWARERSGHSGDRTFDARWRLVAGPFADPDERTVPSPNGGSAAGAAARAWWHLLTERVPDEEVVVMAGLSDTGRLEQVSSIDKKVRAVNDANRDCRGRGVLNQWFDTIIVASHEDKLEAQAEIRRIRDSKELVIPVQVVSGSRD